MDDISNSSNSTIPEGRSPTWLLEIQGVLGLIVSVIGLLANILTILAIIRTPKLRNAASYFIISLSATDILLCTVIMPFTSARHLGSNWVENQGLCILIPFLLYSNVSVSLFAISVITLNRFIKIVHSDVYARIFRLRNVIAMIAGEWIIGFALLLPTLFGVWGQFGFDTKFSICNIIPDVNGRTSKEDLVIVGFVLPFTVIGFCYARILYVVIRSSKRVGETAANGVNQRSILRRMKMVFIIFVAFIGCFLPISIIKVFDKNYNYPGLHVLGRLLAYASAFVNPIIYVIMNRQYRAAYFAVFRDMCRRSTLEITNPRSTNSYYVTSET